MLIKIFYFARDFLQTKKPCWMQSFVRSKGKLLFNVFKQSRKKITIWATISSAVIFSAAQSIVWNKNIVTIKLDIVLNISRISNFWDTKDIPYTPLIIKIKSDVLVNSTVIANNGHSNLFFNFIVDCFFEMVFNFKLQV